MKSEGKNMISENELVNILKDNGITPLKCIYESKERTVVLDDKDINTLISYAKDNNIQYIFYEYRCLEKEDYIIDKDYIMTKFPDSFNEFYKIASNDISKHNKNVNAIDFEQPYLMEAFCIHQGSYVLTSQHVTWIENLLDAENVVRELRLKYNKQLDELRLKTEMEEEKCKELLKEELKNKILLDEDFSRCTNQKIRRYYIEDLLNKTENKKYMEPFKTIGDFYIGRAVAFVEDLWTLIKNSG